MKEILRKIGACAVILCLLILTTTLSLQILVWIFKVDIGNIWQQSIKLSIIAFLVVALGEWRKKKKEIK